MLKLITCLIGKGVEVAEAKGIVVSPTTSLKVRDSVHHTTAGSGSRSPVQEVVWYVRTFLGTEFIVSVGSPGSHPLSPSPIGVGWEPKI